MTPGSHSVLEWNNSGESFSAGETTPGESFCPGIERPQWSHSVLGWNDFRGVILSWDRTTPRKSFSPRIERLHGSPSVLG